MSDVTEPTSVKKKTYRDHVNEAVALEGAAKWSEAAAAWDLARKASKTAKDRATAAGAAAAAKVRSEATAKGEPPPRKQRHEIAVGTVLEHKTRGVVTGTATCVAPGKFEVAGVVHDSINKAANALAAALGQKSSNLNGWLYFGLEKREQDA